MGEDTLMGRESGLASRVDQVRDHDHSVFRPISYTNGNLSRG